MSDNLFFALRAFFITVMTIGMIASLTEFRFGRRKMLTILTLYTVWEVFVSLVLLYVGGELLLLRVFFFFISIPALSLLYWAANDTPAQAIFNYISQIMLSLLGASIIRMVTDSFHLSRAVNLLLMGCFYLAAIYLEGRFLRRPFRMLLTVMPSRWGVLNLIPCVFCAYLIFLATWPGTYLENDAQRVYLYAAIIPIVVVYIAFFRSLISQYHMQLERQSAALLTVQIAALKEKLQNVQEAEEHIRIQRHDLRHQLQAVTELVSRGDRAAALAFLDAAQKRLDEQKAVRWCRLPVLDAVFSSYFNQAQRHDIRVEAKIALPDTLPVDEGELAIVLANALENAIHANLDIPGEQRAIRCKLVGTPSIMLELCNPCTSAVAFDGSGLPVSHREGHGLGVQSICTFCKKNGAACQFEHQNGWFCLRLIL